MNRGRTNILKGLAVTGLSALAALWAVAPQNLDAASASQRGAVGSPCWKVQDEDCMPQTASTCAKTNKRKMCFKTKKDQHCTAGGGTACNTEGCEPTNHQICAAGASE
jgi:hypothetical protein